MPDILTGGFEQKFGIYDQGDKNMIAGDSSSEGAQETQALRLRKGRNGFQRGCSCTEIARLTSMRSKYSTGQLSYLFVPIFILLDSNSPRSDFCQFLSQLEIVKEWALFCIFGRFCRQRINNQPAVMVEKFHSQHPAGHQQLFSGPSLTIRREKECHFGREM